MKIFDFECQTCGKIEEVFMHSDFNEQPCTCGGVMKKIFSLSSHTPIDAPWLAEVLTVVDKNPHKPWCREFLKHPSRANYKAWMQGEGLRHRDPAEPHFKPVNEKERKQKIRKELLNHYREINTVRIGSL